MKHEQEETVSYSVKSETGENNVLLLSLDGTINFKNVSRLQHTLESHLDDSSYTLVKIDFAECKAKDSSLSGLLRSLQHTAKRNNINLEFKSIDLTTQTLLDLSGPEKPEASTLLGPKLGFVERIGDYLLHHHFEMSGMLQFIGRVTISMIWSMRHPQKIRWGEVITLVQRTGAEALPIVALMSALVGLVIAFSSAIQLRQFGANIFIANLIGIGVTRELGPLIAAILLTGRSGSAFAAEIGTMKISDEVDALTVMGVKPLDYLVMPRILAVMLTLPLLTLFADVFGIIGGIVIAIASLDLTPMAFLQQLGKAIGVWDVFSGVMKSFFFGILIAGVGCYRGMATHGGALGVGTSTTASVVSGIFLIVVADSVFVVLFHYLGIG